MSSKARVLSARHLSLAVFILVGMLVAAGCGGQGAGAPGAGGDDSPPSNDRGGEVAAPPDIEGTWTGTQSAEGETARTMLTLEQDGSRVSGYMHSAAEGEGYIYEGLGGDVKPDRSFEVSNEGDVAGSEPPLKIKGSVEEINLMTGKLMDRDGDTGPLWCR